MTPSISWFSMVIVLTCAVVRICIDNRDTSLYPCKFIDCSQRYVRMVLYTGCVKDLKYRSVTKIKGSLFPLSLGKISINPCNGPDAYGGILYQSSYGTNRFRYWEEMIFPWEYMLMSLFCRKSHFVLSLLIWIFYVWLV